MQIVIVHGQVMGVVSFTTGFVPRKKSVNKLSEVDVLSRALWLEKHGKAEEADALLDQWCHTRAIPKK